MESKALLEAVSAWRPRIQMMTEEQATEVIDGKWTRKQILGHLIDSALNNYHRFVKLKTGDLVNFPGYDQEQWVRAGAYASTPLVELTALWVALNKQLAVLIGDADHAASAHVWIDKNLSFGFLVNEYVQHMLRHLPEICEGAPAAKQVIAASGNSPAFAGQGEKTSDGFRERGD
jgi:hypothetical protein